MWLKKRCYLNDLLPCSDVANIRLPYVSCSYPVLRLTDHTTLTLAVCSEAKHSALNMAA